MTDKKYDPVNLVPWLILFGLLFMLAEGADAGDVVQSNDNNLQTAGNVVTEGSLGLGFSYGLGDVDINDCLVSTASGNIIFGKQGFEYNLWCMSEVYDAKGLFRMGAIMRCDIPAIRVHFSDDAACIAANEMTVAVERMPVADFVEHEEIEEQHEERLMEQQQQILELQQMVERAATRPTRAPKPLLSDKQRAALEEVLNE